MCSWGLESQAKTLFDIRVADTYTQSYHAMMFCVLLRVRRSVRIDMPQKGIFTLLCICISVDGMLGSKAKFLSRDQVTFLF